MSRLADGLLALVFLCFPYIALELSVPVGSRVLNAPVADIAALALLPIGFWAAWRHRRSPPGAGYFAAFLAVGCVSAMLSSSVGASLHEWLRKPVFSGIAYGLGVSAIIATQPRIDRLRTALLAGIALASALSLATSIDRILSGDTLWFSAIEGLTNNHKTIAVALAPALVLAWGWAPTSRSRAIVGVGIVAVALSMSRTAWIAGTVGACWFIVWRGRPLAARRGVAAAVVILGVLGATYGPMLTGSLAQLDALRSRHSLDLRAARLFGDHPVLGAGPGASVRDEAQTFPHYRVNGVDAHGVAQKVASEYGLLGVLSYGAFVLSAATIVRRRHRPGDGTFPAFVALHANLLLSTETFNQTHWAMFALTTGLAARTPDSTSAPSALASPGGKG